MSALNDLREYATVTREIRAIERQMDRLMPSGSPSGLRGAGGSRGTNDPTASAMQRADGIEQILEKKRDELREKEIRGERALGLLSDQRARYVLRCYYMLGMSDARIAEDMYRSRSDVQRIRSVAEAQLDAMETP